MNTIRSFTMSLAALATLTAASAVSTGQADAGWRARHAVMAAAQRQSGPRYFGGPGRFAGGQRFAAPVAAPGWGGRSYGNGYGYNRGGWRPGGAAVAVGVIGALATGAIIAGATQPAYAYPSDGYYAPAQYGQGYYAPVQSSQGYYADEGEEYPQQCYLQRRKVWVDNVRWTYRRVQVCR